MQAALQAHPMEVGRSTRRAYSKSASDTLQSIGEGLCGIGRGVSPTGLDHQDLWVVSPQTDPDLFCADEVVALIAQLVEEKEE